MTDELGLEAVQHDFRPDRIWLSCVERSLPPPPGSPAQFLTGIGNHARR